MAVKVCCKKLSAKRLSWKEMNRKVVNILKPILSQYVPESELDKSGKMFGLNGSCLLHIP